MGVYSNTYVVGSGIIEFQIYFVCKCKQSYRKKKCDSFKNARDTFPF